jgi:chromosomal replication initiator protein
LVLTSDKPPKELVDVDERLLSRFHWGLIADIQPPDYEMRMAILKKKSEDEGIELPPEIVEYIARHVKNNVRELEGTLVRLIAKYTFDNREMNLDLAKEVVFGITNFEPKQLTVDDIKEMVSKYFKVPEELIVSKTRKHEVALARQMAMYLTKQFTQLSLKTIGSHFGNRDHSTVLHSCQMIDNYLVTDRSVKQSYENLVQKIKHE